MSDKPKAVAPKKPVEELEKAPAKVADITLYVHGKKFVLPGDTDVEKFLKERKLK